MKNVVSIVLLVLATSSSMAFGQFYSPKEALAQRDSGAAVIYDIREADELAETGMAKGAVFAPTSKIMEKGKQDFLNSLDKDKLHIIYCRSGNRASRVVAMLKSEGFKAENMGGFKHWIAAELQTEVFKN